MKTRDSIRYWAGAIGAAALVAGIVAIMVLVRMQAPKQTAAPPTPAVTRTQAVETWQSAPKAQTMAKPETAPKQSVPLAHNATVKPQPRAKPETAAKPPATPTLTAAERKMSEELWVEQKKLDTDSARAVGALPEGRRRVAEMIAKQLNVPEKVVNELRGRKITYGEVTASLAFSQQLMKRDKVTRQQALDRVLGARTSGQGWAAFARRLDLKIADVLTDVRKTDQQVARLVTLKAAR